DVADHLTQRRVARLGTGMQMAVVGEIASERHIARRDLPFGLCRQPLPGPARKRIGLVKADVTNRFRRIDRPLAGQREDAPFAVVAPPIERRSPALLLYASPAVRQPEFRPAIAA